MNDQIPTTGKLKIAALVQAALANCVLHLGKANLTITPATVVGDFTEATFSGYAAKTITAALAPYIDPVLGGISVALPSQQWDVDGTVDPIVGNTVYNWYLVTAAGVLMAAGSFSPTVDMSLAHQSLPLEVTLNFNTFKVQATTF